MEIFKFIKSNVTNPEFNIASEEYLLKHTDGFYVYLWQNSPAVIIGNNQNTLLEVNLSATQSKGVKVVRRLTGGGAVYHDLNNVCYTVIAPYSTGENYYEKFTTPVIEFLNSLGVKAEFSGRNDICVGGRKISGNAQVVYKGKIMHHGTLLFDTDLSTLSDVLIENKLKIQSKAIKSNRARVTNIKEHLLSPLTCKEFFDLLSEHMRKDLEEYTFTDEDICSIDKLVKEKYSTYEWNIGNSPLGSNRFDARLPFGTLTLTFDLKEGLICAPALYGDFFANGNVQEFINNLCGKRFIYEEVFNALDGIDKVIKGANTKDIADELFK